MRKIYWASGILAAILAGLLVVARFDSCWWRELTERLLASLGASPASTLRTTFLGASSLLVEDGDRAILIDGFFTRPNLGLIPSESDQVSPDATAIDNALATLQVSTTTLPRALTLAAVVVNHSHYDHVLDAPLVAEQTGALLVGSESTANVGRSRGLAENRLRIFGSGATSYCFAPFRLTVVPTGHVPIGGGTPFAGNITTTTVPQTVGDYKEGGTFAIFVRRRGKTLLVQGSAGFAAGALANRAADVVFLAVGGLAGFAGAGQAHRDAYWNEVVGNVAPRRIFPIHWDNLSGPLDKNVSPNFGGNAGISDVTTRAQAANIEVRTPVVMEKFDPFEGL